MIRLGFRLVLQSEESAVDIPRSGTATSGVESGRSSEEDSLFAIGSPRAMAISAGVGSEVGASSIDGSLELASLDSSGMSCSIISESAEKIRTTSRGGMTEKVGSDDSPPVSGIVTSGASSPQFEIVI